MTDKQTAPEPRAAPTAARAGTALCDSVLDRQVIDTDLATDDRETAIYADARNRITTAVDSHADTRMEIERI